MTMDGGPRVPGTGEEAGGSPRKPSEVMECSGSGLRSWLHGFTHLWKFIRWYTVHRYTLLGVNCTSIGLLFFFQ